FPYTTLFRSLGGRAADARDRARPYGQAQDPHVRRAIARALSALGPESLRDHPYAQAGGPDDAARRAERADVARCERLRLRHEPRPGRDRRASPRGPRVGDRSEGLSRALERRSGTQRRGLTP